MKNLMAIGLMLSSFVVIQAMELEKLELGTEQKYSSTQIIQELRKDHSEVLALIPEEQRENVLNIMQEKRQNLVNYVMTKQGSITPQELIKQYGENALAYFQSYTVYGSAILDIMHDKVYLEKSKKRVKNYSHLKLAALAEGIENLATKLQKKKKHKKIIEKKDSNEIMLQYLEEKKEQFFTVNENVTSLQNALRCECASLYRAFPQGDEDLILERFVDKYPVLAQKIIKKQKKSLCFKAIPLIDVEQLGTVLIENNENLAKAYEEYKILKGLLEAAGINVEGIKKALVQELQLVVNEFAEKISDLNNYAVEKCCTIL